MLHDRTIDPAASSVGAKVRARLLEAAGEVFATKGFEGATSREICLRAGVNLAAVNYHFGGVEALYVAALREAHSRTTWVDKVNLEGFADQPATEKLKAVLRYLVLELAGPGDAWEMRLVYRELTIPTFAHEAFLAAGIEPRRAFMRDIIAEILDCPPEAPAVGRCMLSVMAPWMTLSVINRPTLHTFLPDLDEHCDGVERLVDHVERFVLAGIEAIKVDLESALAN
ncbi:MAG TPA: CerR family C-terminal domain-containing protein [Caulobacteraceae bacterium]|jgi:AcrR family transcriptional regulator|nr:CerR family C-terminal domain-containing protein [Caulobacteraceae bacterium]